MSNQQATSKTSTIESTSNDWTCYRPRRRPILLGFSIVALIVWIGFMVSIIAG